MSVWLFMICGFEFWAEATICIAVDDIVLEPGTKVHAILEGRVCLDMHSIEDVMLFVYRQLNLHYTATISNPSLSG